MRGVTRSGGASRFWGTRLHRTFHARSTGAESGRWRCSWASRQQRLPPGIMRRMSRCGSSTLMVPNVLVHWPVTGASLSNLPRQSARLSRSKGRRTSPVSTGRRRPGPRWATSRGWNGTRRWPWISTRRSSLCRPSPSALPGRGWNANGSTLRKPRGTSMGSCPAPSGRAGSRTTAPAYTHRGRPSGSLHVRVHRPTHHAMTEAHFRHQRFFRKYGPLCPERDPAPRQPRSSSSASMSRIPWCVSVTIAGVFPCAQSTVMSPSPTR
jgi:hypothetical protein